MNHSLRSAGHDHHSHSHGHGRRDGEFRRRAMMDGGMMAGADFLSMFGSMLGGMGIGDHEHAESDDFPGQRMAVVVGGPEGRRMIGETTITGRDLAMLRMGRIPDHLRAMIEAEEKKTDHERKLDELKRIDERMSLAMKVAMYAAEGGAEIARFLKTGKGAREDLVIAMHLGHVLNVAKTDDPERFKHLEQRLAGYRYDLGKLIVAIEQFFEKKTPNKARHLLALMGRVNPIATGIDDDVKTDVAEQAKEAQTLREQTLRV